MGSPAGFKFGRQQEPLGHYGSGLHAPVLRFQPGLQSMWTSGAELSADIVQMLPAPMSDSSQRSASTSGPAQFFEWPCNFVSQAFASVPNSGSHRSRSLESRLSNVGNYA